MSNAKNKSLWNRFSVTTWLIIVSVIASIVGFFLFNNYADYIALKPSNILQGKYLWTLVTHMFIHGSLTHLLVNMLALFSLGKLCEKIIGRKRFFWFYMTAGLAAGILSVLASGYLGTTELGAKILGSPDIFMVGASGAIFGIAGLYVILLPKLKFMIIFLPFFSFPAYVIIPLTLALMWAASILFNWPIGNMAHLGGFLVGIFYGLYLKSKYKRKVTQLQQMFR